MSLSVFESESKLNTAFNERFNVLSSSMRTQYEFDGTSFFSTKMQVTKMHEFPEYKLDKLHESKNMLYEKRFVMGTLKKRGMQTGIFKNSLYKRFFIMNNETRKIQIFKDSSQAGIPIEFNYSDILRVNEGISIRHKKSKPKWSF